MPFYSSVKYNGKYRTQNHFIAMIRTPLLSLLYKKNPKKQQNTKKPPNNPKTKKHQNNKTPNSRDLYPQLV